MVCDFGIMEATDAGQYYLTIRMNLMDYTSGHGFWVQKWGSGSWKKANAAISKRGSDSNGTTADIVIQVPDSACVVRGSIYVAPMGRNVVWYMYPSDYAEGGNDEMNATIVSGSGSQEQSRQEGNQQMPAQQMQPQQNQYAYEDEYDEEDNQPRQIELPAKGQGSHAPLAETAVSSGQGSSSLSSGSSSLSAPGDTALVRNIQGLRLSTEREFGTAAAKKTPEKAAASGTVSAMQIFFRLLPES